MTSGTNGFQGWTQGPGYWGKKFYYWPPDPTNDWRTAYFNFPTAKRRQFARCGIAAATCKVPSSSGYQINYTAILNFIQNMGPSIFPSPTAIGPHPLLQFNPQHHRHFGVAACRGKVWRGDSGGHYGDELRYIAGDFSASHAAFSLFSRNRTG